MLGGSRSSPNSVNAVDDDDDIFFRGDDDIWTRGSLIVCCDCDWVLFVFAQSKTFFSDRNRRRVRRGSSIGAEKTEPEAAKNDDEEELESIKFVKCVHFILYSVTMLAVCCSCLSVLGFELCIVN